MTNNGKRVAWVTGGGSGIGEAGAEALAADGWTVVVSGRRKDALDAVVAKITRSGGKAEAIVLDVSKSDDVTRAADQILARHGRIDLLVNSAGINVPKRSWADMELEGWDKLVEINLNGVVVLHARGAAGDAPATGRLHHQRRVLGRPSCVENARARLHHHQARGAGADPFLQHG